MRAQWIVAMGIAAMLAAGCSRQESGWQDASEHDTIAAYQDYLSRYPAGAHSDEARARMLALREAEAWAVASRLRLPEAWQRYLSDWPDGVHAEEARRELADFATVTPARAEARVDQGHAAQLGAFSSEAAAQKERSRLLREQATLLDGRSWQVVPPAAGAPALWRLRIGPLPEAEARSLCVSLRDSGIDCVAVAG